ncbi:hypothetical protein [Neobacillus mesonae]|uniref:hypothetical protein n=1 Tax=Neobacillus mesonae TaxID=1193713 RepID=UPI00203AE73C|nr:hypothetical protein [Neobacillus mesonae]MCM3567547.1 hypothetical protein [Neobacillus mesonae]
MFKQFRLADGEYLSEFSKQRHEMKKTKKKNVKPYIRNVELNWVRQAMDSKYKKPLVTLLVLYYSSLNKDKRFYIPSSKLEEWGITRQTYCLTLKELADKGLIEIQKSQGSKTRIKVLKLVES